MLDPTTSRFWQAALQSSLLDAEALAACWEAIPPEKRDAPEHIDRRLGRQAVLLDLLTLWQAQQLLAGRITGFRVDRYVLEDLIGQGGMGRVYCARDTRLDRQVALKILSPDRINNPRAIARFRREAKVGAQLQHENLVRLYDFGESQGRHYLVMEFIEGKTLGFHIAVQGRIPPSAAAQFGRQVALGLDHAHNKGLIHRDVNPYNVIVTHDGIAKLADMGLAIDLADEAKVTRDGATVGTFDYVAPEQARHSHSADIRSDIYSLGCSLYHMIAGQVPFPHPGLAEKLFAHQSQEPPRLEDLVPELPPGLGEVVRTMMRKKPEERFQTPYEVAVALKPFADKSSERRPVLAVGAKSVESRGTELPSDAPAVGSTGETGSEADVSEEFPIHVDLREPALLDSVRPNRSWFSSSGSKPSSGSDGGSAVSDAGSASVSSTLETILSGRRKMAAGVLLGLLALGAVGLAVFWRGGGAGAGHAQTPPTNLVGGKLVQPTPRPAPIDWGDSSIAVQSADHSPKPVPDLLQAMEAAIAGKGIVVLKPGTPIEFKSGPGRMVSGRGNLLIKGGGEAPVVVKVELDGDQPFISVGPGVNLELRNLIFEVNRTKSPAASSPPVLLLAGKGLIDHCAFRTAPFEGYQGSRAVVSDGAVLDVSDCWFEGFATALEIQAMAGPQHTIRQSMFVPGGTPTEAVQAEKSVRRGWAAKIAFGGGGVRDAGRSIRMEHCTVAGEGIFQIAGFSENAPLLLDVVSCAAKVDRLIDWTPAQSDDPWKPGLLKWSGVDNQLDVIGDAWVAGPNGVAAVAGFDDWSKAFQETGAIRTGVQFSMAPAAVDGRLTPNAYSLVRPDATRPGADPQLVGTKPWK
ncbi:serine/threonine-protein kinase [Paludisphaera rhizosphaerae]|uniref:serine/threonine-protein kinase n=1 Tax=Paludisphaera rhizosphaerae TaxID=2711216 RepID=UPI0013EB4B79|nr:serine/threonine-protein kinase [Paludisphaera rhizosphaerae]